MNAQEVFLDCLSSEFQSEVDAITDWVREGLIFNPQKYAELVGKDNKDLMGRLEAYDTLIRQNILQIDSDSVSKMDMYLQALIRDLPKVTSVPAAWEWQDKADKIFDMVDK